MLYRYQNSTKLVKLKNNHGNQ